MENNFYSKNLSYSQMRTFITNSGNWQNQRVLGIYDNKTSVAGATGSMLHVFMEEYINNGNINDAINTCHKCLYEADNGKSYIINPVVRDMPFDKILEDYKTTEIDFKKTGSPQQLLKNISSGIEAVLSEKIHFGEVLGVEKDMEHSANEKVGNVNFVSPIPFKCIADLVGRTTEETTILVGGKLEKIPVDSLYIRDWKFKGKHSVMNEEDPSYIFQAFFNYYCVKIEYGEAPLFIEYREIKISKNRDNSSQHQTVTILFEGENFEIYKAFFWRFITEVFERMLVLQDRDFLFNIFDAYNSSDEWEKQKSYYMGVPFGTLEQTIISTQKNKIGSKTQIMGDRDPLKSKIRLDNAEYEEINLNSYENKIRVTFQNFGVKADFEKVNEGYSFDQYLFTPGRGITMSKIKSLLPEIMQSLELGEGARIEAPVVGTKFVGVEIPREKRNFAELKKLPRSKHSLIPIGVDVTGKMETVNLSDGGTPHLIVAGMTGSGKSEFLKTAVFALRNKGQIYLLDPKITGLKKVAKYANKCNHITDVPEMRTKLQKLYDDMMGTYHILASKDCEDIDEYNDIKGTRKLKRHFIFIDEFANIANFTRQVMELQDNEKTKAVIDKVGADIMYLVEQITALGRAAGYHLILATQRPTVNVISGTIKSNMPARVCFCLGDETSSKVVLDEVGAERLLSKGDMIFKTEGKKQRLQGYFINDKK